MATGDLIDQAYYQLATGSAADTRVPSLITAASSLIRQYLQRALGLPIQTETRTFDFDGSGVVEIDDVVNVTAVVIGAHTLATAEYLLRPRSAPEDGMPYYWLEVTPSRAVSPEMGFMSNLDQYPLLGSSLVEPLSVDVTGDFGWPTVPEAAKEATVWTIQEWLIDPGSGGELSAESIADFSRSWSVPTNRPPSVAALPEHAREALDPLARDEV